jgi:hypothetical protein
MVAMKTMKANSKQLKKPMKAKKVEKSVYTNIQKVSNLVGMSHRRVALVIHALTCVAGDALEEGEVFNVGGPIDFVLKPMKSQKAMKGTRSQSGDRHARRVQLEAMTRNIAKMPKLGVWASTSSSSGEECD